jgi:hypothetical protein
VSAPVSTAPKAPAAPGSTVPAPPSPAPAVSVRRPPSPRVTERRTVRRRLTRSESFWLFAIAFALYSALGLVMALEFHVVVWDAHSRLAHAYFVFYDSPPKLAAVGFEWPPVLTLVFLPLAAIKPLATSLAALPLTSAVFGAGMLVVLNTGLTFCGMRWPLRYPLLIPFGIGPMILFYATNGMGEIVYLFFVLAAFVALMRWYQTQRSHLLALAGMSMALGVLSRWEVMFWAVIATVMIIAVLWRRRVDRAEGEGSLLLFLAPIAYGLTLWCFFNWLILGNPLYWLTKQGTNLAAGRGVAEAAEIKAIPFSTVVEKTLSLNFEMFPLAAIVLVLLVVVAAVRRDGFSVALAVAIALNALLTIVFVMKARDESLLQLRYNMRAIPLAVLGAAWVFWLLRPRLSAFAVWGGTFVALIAAIPLQWHLMRTYPFQFLEPAFIEALATRKPQDSDGRKFGYRVGLGPEQQMTAAIKKLHPGHDEILTDDAQTFGVMLNTGHPEWFFDRIAYGDKRFKEVLHDPYGTVKWILVDNRGQPEMVRDCYPTIAQGGVPGTRVIARNTLYTLLEVAPRMPLEVRRRLKAAGPGATPCAK